MMNTPICDFVRKYAESGALRLHMPGHKGAGALGFESLDITEIQGADSLHEASGIIRESEENAGSLFGCETFYSVEGSSLCIRAMLYLAMKYALQNNKKPLIAAGRNAHKTFLSGAALLDIDVMWLYPEEKESYLSCRIDAASLDKALTEAAEKPAAVYVTSPDYLGNILDIASIAKVCRKHGALLLVDNAHGAYLKFLSESRHPMDLGADMCCDSAHKTLPVLTGGAYLHVSRTADEMFKGEAKQALALFASTSPSYLILQSLDTANEYICDGYREKLADFVQQVANLKSELISHGYSIASGEPLKLTLEAKKYGYRGDELADILLSKNIVCEFCDPDFLVLMLTPETGSAGLIRLFEALKGIPKRTAVTETPPEFHAPERVMTARDAAFAPSETVPVKKSMGRVLAAANVSCPPAVPIVVCGERIDKAAVKCFEYYGIKECAVVRE